MNINNNNIVYLGSAINQNSGGGGAISSNNLEVVLLKDFNGATGRQVLDIPLDDIEAIVYTAHMGNIYISGNALVSEWKKGKILYASGNNITAANDVKYSSCSYVDNNTVDITLYSTGGGVAMQTGYLYGFRKKKNSGSLSHLYEHHCICYNVNPELSNLNSIQFNIINNVKDAWQTREECGDWIVKNIGNTTKNVINAVYMSGNSVCPNVYFSNKNTMLFADNSRFSATTWGAEYFEDKVRTII